jgi:hypothetical protein
MHSMSIRSLALVLLIAIAGCHPPRSYTRPTPYPLRDAFSCALAQLGELEYDVVLADTIAKRPGAVPRRPPR